MILLTRKTLLLSKLKDATNRESKFVGFFGFGDISSNE